MMRHGLVAQLVVGLMLVLGDGADIRTTVAPVQAPQDGVEQRQRLEVFTGDRIRLTHHDQSVSEGILVSMGVLSLTLADTADISDCRLIFFDSIAEFAVARGDSSVSVKAYRVERAWLGFSEGAPADSTTE